MTEYTHDLQKQSSTVLHVHLSAMSPIRSEYILSNNCVKQLSIQQIDEN